MDFRRGSNRRRRKRGVKRPQFGELDDEGSSLPGCDDGSLLDDDEGGSLLGCDDGSLLDDDDEGGSLLGCDDGSLLDDEDPFSKSAAFGLVALVSAGEPAPLNFRKKFFSAANMAEPYQKNPGYGKTFPLSGELFSVLRRAPTIIPIDFEALVKARESL